MDNHNFSEHQEIWKDIPGYETIYQVSDMGNVRRLPASNTRPSLYVLRHAIDRKGYHSVKLYHPDKTPKTIKVYRLVMLAFVGERPNKWQINHKNGVKSDNRLCNLEYCTGQQNMRHAYDVLHRNTLKGETNSQSKLTETQVREIRKLASEGLSQRKIAAIFGVSPRTILFIKHGKHWNHVDI